MAYRLSPRAQADVDDIAHYIAVESGGLDTTDRLIDPFIAGSSC